MENKLFCLKDKDRNIISAKMIVAETIFSRMKGLMFTEEMPDCDGLLISPCNSIHTFFMLFNLDVLFLDKNFVVIKAIYNMPPWRMTWIYFKASKVLEMKGGTMKKGIQKGEKLEAVCIN